MPPLLAALGAGGTAAGAGTAGGATALGATAGATGATGATLAIPTAAAGLGATAAGAASPLLPSIGLASSTPGWLSSLGTGVQNFGQGLGQGVFGGDPSTSGYRFGAQASQELLKPRAQGDGGFQYVQGYMGQQAQRRHALFQSLGLL